MLPLFLQTLYSSFSGATSTVISAAHTKLVSRSSDASSSAEKTSSSTRTRTSTRTRNRNNDRRLQAPLCPPEWFDGSTGLCGVSSLECLVGSAFVPDSFICAPFSAIPWISALISIEFSELSPPPHSPLDAFILPSDIGQGWRVEGVCSKTAPSVSFHPDLFLAELAILFTTLSSVPVGALDMRFAPSIDTPCAFKLYSNSTGSILALAQAVILLAATDFSSSNFLMPSLHLLPLFNFVGLSENSTRSLGDTMLAEIIPTGVDKISLKHFPVTFSSPLNSPSDSNLSPGGISGIVFGTLFILFIIILLACRLPWKSQRSPPSMGPLSSVNLHENNQNHSQQQESTAHFSLGAAAQNVSYVSHYRGGRGLYSPTTAAADNNGIRESQLEFFFEPKIFLPRGRENLQSTTSAAADYLEGDDYVTSRANAASGSGGTLRRRANRTSGSSGASQMQVHVDI